MSPTINRSRIALTVLYFVFVCGILFLDSRDNPFCNRPGEVGPATITFRLALACTVWYLLAGTIGQKLAISQTRSAPAVVVGVLTLVGFASIPFWIYGDPGHFRFEGTWADVSCFFTEGYGMVFPFVIAPVLAFGAVVCEVIFQFQQVKKAQPPVSS